MALDTLNSRLRKLLQKPCQSWMGRNWATKQSRLATTRSKTSLHHHSSSSRQPSRVPHRQKQAALITKCCS
jgi:hypothetical protein